MNDGTEAALRQLTGAVGELTGRMDGNNRRMDELGREIGQLRELIEKRDNSCNNCRGEIDAKISAIDGAINVAKGAEVAKKSLWDNIWTRTGIAASCVLGVISFIWTVIH
jgi:chromosome segregation ATPase